MFMTGVLCTVCGAQVYLIRKLVRDDLSFNKSITDKDWKKCSSSMQLFAYRIICKNMDFLKSANTYLKDAL